MEHALQICQYLVENWGMASFTQEIALANRSGFKVFFIRNPCPSSAPPIKSRIWQHWKSFCPSHHDPLYQLPRISFSEEETKHIYLYINGLFSLLKMTSKYIIRWVLCLLCGTIDKSLLTPFPSQLQWSVCYRQVRVRMSKLKRDCFKGDHPWCHSR